jgi:hypothetical protein
MGSCTLQIKSSSGGTYAVIVDFDDDGVTKMGCDCSAGMFGDFCKHLRTLFEADETLLSDVEQADLFRHLSALTLRSMPGSRYAKLQSDLKHVETEQKALKKRVSDLKHEFMRYLS